MTLYKYGSLSPSDPSQTPMRFVTYEEAKSHSDLMTSLIPRWFADDGWWNKEHWKLPPEPWITFELETK